MPSFGMKPWSVIVIILFDTDVQLNVLSCFSWLPKIQAAFHDKSFQYGFYHQARVDRSLEISHQNEIELEVDWKAKWHHVFK